MALTDRQSLYSLHHKRPKKSGKVGRASKHHSMLLTRQKKEPKSVWVEKALVMSTVKLKKYGILHMAQNNQ